MVKTLAFVFGLCICAVGVIGVLAPSVLVWLAQQFTNPGSFYLIAAVRIAFGLLLISVASASRAPRALRGLGFVIVTLGIASAIAALVAIDRARGAIEWWLQQGPEAFRLTSIVVLALGSFVAWACAPKRGAA
jgi:cell division protein FtsW (lipid II flippase)